MAQGPASREDLMIVWQTIEGRRATYDTMMWQSPALGLAAQAFLLTIGLSADASRVARVLASALAVAVALMSMQLMAKHRFHELVDNQMLARLEASLGLDDAVGGAPHGHVGGRHTSDVAAARALMPRVTRRVGFFWSSSSFAVWLAGLGLFAVVSLAVLVLSVLGVSVFGVSVGTA